MSKKFSELTPNDFAYKVTANSIDELEITSASDAGENAEQFYFKSPQGGSLSLKVTDITLSSFKVVLSNDETFIATDEAAANLKQTEIRQQLVDDAQAKLTNAQTLLSSPNSVINRYTK